MPMLRYRVGDLSAYENGELTPRATVRLFAALVKTGDAWTLQGSYGRAAARLIEDGFIEARTGKILREPGDAEDWN